MTQQLREELTALADTQTFSPDPSAWDRGRRARRRTRVAAGVAALVVVAGLGAGAAVWTTDDHEARTASTTLVEGGAIPSRIEDPGELELETDLAIGRVSVAFFSAEGQPVVVGAADGRYHALDLPDLSRDLGPLAVSPDGRHLAWRSNGRIHVADLEDGTTTYYPSTDERARVTDLRWAPSSSQLLWDGRSKDGGRTGGVLPVGDPSGDPLIRSALHGIPSPGGELVAVASPGTVDAAPFLRRRGRAVERRLPVDLYPDGATVTPLGWAADHLVAAQAYGPPGSYVEGQHLVLFTSPDRPESEWTYRILLRDIPQDAVPLSLAVDLVPDLDGTSAQVLTHDFGDASPAEDTGRGPVPYVLGALMALLSGLAFVRMMIRRA